MAKVMKASEFVRRLRDVVERYDTLYVMGCFGAPLTTSNKKRYTKNHDYNKDPKRTAMINAASADTFGFDCVNLIKGILWGWCGDESKVYGGAKYTANGIPDVGADRMITLCSDVSTNFDKIEVGEAVWTTGHIGIYIGNGLAIECTPAWKNRVQVTACNCKKPGYNTRTWKKHGKLPWIEYDVKEVTSEPVAAKVKIDAAMKKDRKLAGAYKITAKAGLNIRTGAGSKKTSLGILPYGTVVNNYGFFNSASNGVKWLYVKTADGKLGYCSSAYLKKC